MQVNRNRQIKEMIEARILRNEIGPFDVAAFARKVRECEPQPQTRVGDPESTLLRMREWHAPMNDPLTSEELRAGIQKVIDSLPRLLQELVIDGQMEQADQALIQQFLAFRAEVERRSCLKDLE